MSYINDILIFFSINYSKVKPSIKGMYKVYLIISLLNPNLTFKKFYKDTTFLVKMSGIDIIRRRILFMYLLFSYKTLPIIKTKGINHNFQVTRQRDGFFTQVLNPAKEEIRLTYF